MSCRQLLYYKTLNIFANSILIAIMEFLVLLYSNFSFFENHPWYSAEFTIFLLGKIILSLLFSFTHFNLLLFNTIFLKFFNPKNSLML